MAWTTPLTAVANTPLTAAQWNASVRDNLNMSPVALATTAGYHFVSTGTNAVAERGILQTAIDGASTTSSTSYTDLAAGAGPAVTITTGTQALVWINAAIANSAASTSAASFNISGASTIAANDNWDIQQDGGAGAANRYSSCTLIVGLTSGSNIFTMKYLVSSGATTGTFSRRRIQVMGM